MSLLTAQNDARAWAMYWDEIRQLRKRGMSEESLAVALDVLEEEGRDAFCAWVAKELGAVRYPPLCLPKPLSFVELMKRRYPLSNAPLPDIVYDAIEARVRWYCSDLATIPGRNGVFTIPDDA